MPYDPITGITTPDDPPQQYIDNNPSSQAAMPGATLPPPGGFPNEDPKAPYGYYASGTPREEPVPEGPACPPVSMSDGPFDTTSIPPGCSAPLSQECADFYNAKYGYENSQ